MTTHRHISLKEMTGIKNNSRTFISFTGYFQMEVEKLINENPEHWKSGNVYGTLCELIEKTDDLEINLVSIPIEDEEGNDGGYVHVWGWKEK